MVDASNPTSASAFDKAKQAAEDGINRAEDAVKKGLETGKQKLDDAIDTTREGLHRAEDAVKKGVETSKQKLNDAIDTTAERVDQAHMFIKDQARERPVALTAAAIGVGLLVGLVLANNGRRR
jgi:ElaB/YqjD/DUF883 family membrane-anchored ribosome-binding protein